MKRGFLVLLALLISVSGVFAQANPPIPPQYDFALRYLSQYLGRTVSAADFPTWSFTISPVTTTALGCPLATGQALPSPILSYHFIITIRGATYDVRTSEDGGLGLVCAPPLTGATAAPTLAPLTASTPVPVVTPQPCPAGFAGYLPPRLNLNAEARIPGGGTPNRLRAAPSVNAPQIGVINPTIVVRVLNGPSCEPQSQIIWWQVRVGQLVGWTAEGMLPDDYFLDPVGNVTPPTASGLPATSPGGEIPLERSVINSSNIAADFTVFASLPIDRVSSLAFAPSSGALAVVSHGLVQVFTLPDLVIDEAIVQPVTVPPSSAAAFLPDASALLVGQVDGVLAYYSLTGVRTVLPAPIGAGVTDLGFSPVTAPTGLPQVPVNRFAAAAGSGGAGRSGVYMIDRASGHTVVRVDTSAPVTSVAFSTDGSVLAYFDQAVHIIDTIANRETRNFPMADAGFGVLAWRPETPLIGLAPAQTLAFGDGFAIRLVRLADNSTRSIALEPGQRVRDLAFSPDGTLLYAIGTADTPTTISGQPNSLYVFAAATGTPLLRLDGDGFHTLAVSPDGTLLAISDGVEVTLWGV